MVLSVTIEAMAPDDEPIRGVQNDGLESVPSREIGRRTKRQIGALIFAAGVIWFLFDLMMLPPALALVYGLLYPLNPPEILGTVLLPVEFVVAAGTVGYGYLTWRSMRKINTTSGL